MVFVFRRKPAYEMRISDWSSDVCSSDLLGKRAVDQRRDVVERKATMARPAGGGAAAEQFRPQDAARFKLAGRVPRLQHFGPDMAVGAGTMQIGRAHV